MTEMKKMEFLRYSYPLMSGLEIAHAEIGLNYMLVVVNAKGNVIVLGKTAFDEWGVIDHSTHTSMTDMLTQWSNVSRDLLIDKINAAARTNDAQFQRLNAHGLDLLRALGYIPAE